MIPISVLGEFNFGGTDTEGINYIIGKGLESLYVDAATVLMIYVGSLTGSVEYTKQAFTAPGIQLNMQTEYFSNFARAWIWVVLAQNVAPYGVKTLLNMMAGCILVSPTPERHRTIMVRFVATQVG